MSTSASFAISLLSAEGNSVNEPNCQVQFMRNTGEVVVPANHLEFPPGHTFTLPAFPQERYLYCRVTPSRYRPVESNFFMLNAGQTMSIAPVVARDPSEWQPNFVQWNSLGTPFDRLKATMDGQYVTLKHGQDVGVVTGSVFDAMSSTTALVMAKMALLNLFVVTSSQVDPVSTKPWFTFVRQVLRLDRERFVAIVTSDFYESVDYIRNNLGAFRDQGFFMGDSSLHVDNIPSDYQLTQEMISVKRSYAQGNVQFTMAKVMKGRTKAILLDCDMDENSNPFDHGVDLLKHVFTGGTNPIDIHEYIVRAQPGVELGYGLYPIGEPAPAKSARVAMAAVAGRGGGSAVAQTRLTKKSGRAERKRG